MTDTDPLRDLELLIRSRYSLLLLETEEEDRAEALLRHLADRLAVAFFSWTSTKGLRRVELKDDGAITGTADLAKTLALIEQSPPAIYHLRGVTDALGDAQLAARAKDAAGRFVVATANDIDRLPPEFVRKGRFDEIFFVDLPDADARRAVFEIHLRKRKQDPARFDLPALAKAADGFSGAEIEQAIVSGLYTAFNVAAPLSTEGLLAEIAHTRPLSQTMSEKIEGLRSWARDRTVPAN